MFGKHLLRSTNVYLFISKILLKLLRDFSQKKENLITKKNYGITSRFA